MERQRFDINDPGWVWLYCQRPHPYCGRSQPVALVPYAIRWQLRDSMAVMAELRRQARCTVCGWRGVATRLPTWCDMTIGASPFPVDQMKR